MIAVGARNKRLTIEQPVDTLNAQGEPVQSWMPFRTVWARLDPLDGRELYVAQQRAPQVTHRVTVAYLPGVTPKMRLNLSGRLFDILAPMNPEERNVELQLLCKERL